MAGNSRDQAAVEPQAARLPDLAALAERRGFELRQTPTGFLLRRGASSWHSSDLMALAPLLRG